MSDIPKGLDAFLAEPSETPSIQAPTPEASPDRAPAAVQPTPSAQPGPVTAPPPPGLDAFLEDATKDDKYSTPGQQALAAIEGVASGATAGLSKPIETASGLTSIQDIKGREEANPGTHIASEMGGLGLSALTGVGAAPLLEEAGAGISAAAGLGGASALSRVGSAIVKSAAENAIFQGTDEASKALAQDPDSSVSSALINTGLAGVIGGGAGAILGGVPELWKSSSAEKTGGLLNMIKSRLGGAEGAPVSDAIQTAMDTSGMEIAPEIRSALSDDPYLQKAAKGLEQEDTTKAGRAYQESFQDFKENANEGLASALGKTPEEAAALRLDHSKANNGRQVGNALIEQLKPIEDSVSGDYQKWEGDYASEQLPHDKVEQVQTNKNNPYEQPKYKSQVTPGTISLASDEIAQAAVQNRWVSSTNSEIQSLVSNVQKQLPKQKTLGDLQAMIQDVSRPTNADIGNGQLRYVRGKLAQILTDHYEAALGAKIGSEEGTEAFQRFLGIKKAFREYAELIEPIRDRLPFKSSVSGFTKALKEYVAEDPEALMRKLSGVDDSAWLSHVSEKLPGAAQAIRNFHTDDLLSRAAKGAKAGDFISSGKLLGDIQKMSPELRQFAIPEEAIQKINALDTLLDKYHQLPHNFSNTGRTADWLMQHLPGSAVAMVTMLSGHNPALALLLGGMTKTIGKDIPASTRLALLKFLGSAQETSPEGFKAMADFIDHAIKGQKLMGRASKALFQAGKTVLPETMFPDQKDRDKLDKKLKDLQSNESGLMDIGGHVGHYLPDHGTALTGTAGNAVSYLNSIRPQPTQKSPLDTKIEPSKAQMAEYHRALDIAQQPLIVLHKIKDGTITSKDVLHLNAMYPGVYAKMRDNVMQTMLDHVNTGVSIPYKTRIGMSLFMGQPLDSTLTPQGILGAQPMPAAPQGGGMPGAKPGQKPKHSTSALGHMASLYQTPGQAAQKDKLRE